MAARKVGCGPAGTAVGRSRRPPDIAGGAVALHVCEVRQRARLHGRATRLPGWDRRDGFSPTVSPKRLRRPRPGTVRPRIKHGGARSRVRICHAPPPRSGFCRCRPRVLIRLSRLPLIPFGPCNLNASFSGSCLARRRKVPPGPHRLHRVGVSEPVWWRGGAWGRTVSVIHSGSGGGEDSPEINEAGRGVLHASDRI